MDSPFDAKRHAARYLHRSRCGRDHAFDVADCLLVASGAVADFLDELRAVGLALVPVETLRFLGLRHDSVLAAAAAASSETLPESDAPGWFAEMHLGQVRVVETLQDGSKRRSDFMPHHDAVAHLAYLNCDHDPEVVSAIIEPEPDFISDICREFDL